MPYIKENRDTLTNHAMASVGSIATVGELNFFITRVIQSYMDIHQISNYEGYNSMIGVLECVKSEFYRRAVAEYENQKCKENGDVF